MANHFLLMNWGLLRLWGWEPLGQPTSKADLLCFVVLFPLSTAPLEAMCFQFECVQTRETRQKTDVFHTISSQIMSLFLCMLLALLHLLLSAKYNGRETIKKKQMCNYSVYVKVGKISLHCKEVFKPMGLFLQIQKKIHHLKVQDVSKEYNSM